MNVTSQYASPDDKLWMRNAARYAAALSSVLSNPMYRDVIGTPAELVYQRALWLVCHTEGSADDLRSPMRVPHEMLSETLRQVTESNKALRQLVSVGLFVEDPVHEGFLLTPPYQPPPTSWTA